MGFLPGWKLPVLCAGRYMGLSPLPVRPLRRICGACERLNIDVNKKTALLRLPLQYLISEGAEIQAKNENERSAFHLAAMSGHPR